MSNSISPGAALLRSSRMFSVPKPLQSPLNEAWAVGRHHSPSMTIPYPTHQSITTPEHSRVLGDWGFKRALPLRSTAKTSTPVVRIRQIDCFENVTDYKSAADHTISLQKFQELNLPMTLPSPNRSRLGGLNVGAKSVFEDDGDFTVMEAGRQNEAKRWNFKGPWLAGLTEGKFDRYLRYKVRNRREEFRKFAKQRLADEMNAEEQQKTLDAGKKTAQTVQPEDITEQMLVQYFRKLRHDRVTLYSMISEFLDLAPLQPPISLTGINPLMEKTKRPSLYAENGPPISHPSGGISYLRTAAFVENHPIYGPQAHHSPVLSRIVSPRNGPNSAKLGVGGFITDVPQGDSTFNQRSWRGSKNLVAGIATFDPDTRGGAKSYVEPISARMSSSGSVQITVIDANEEAQLINKEMVGRARIYNDRTEPEVHVEPRRPLGPRISKIPQPEAQPQPQPQQTIGSSQTYGLDS